MSPILLEKMLSSVDNRTDVETGIEETEYDDGAAGCVSAPCAADRCGDNAPVSA